MQVERADAADVDEISILFNDYRVFYGKPADLQGARKFLNDRLVNEESVIFIARTEKIAGFVQLYPIFSSTRMKRLWLLNDLFVAPAFRGTGTSLALMDAAKQFSIQTESCGLILETTKDNQVANRLYQRIGCEIDNDHNYYSWSK